VLKVHPVVVVVAIDHLVLHALVVVPLIFFEYFPLCCHSADNEEGLRQTLRIRGVEVVEQHVVGAATQDQFAVY